MRLKDIEQEECVRSIEVIDQREYIVRGKFWGTWSAVDVMGIRDLAASAANREHHDEDEDDERQEAEPAAGVLVGTASSTGVDSHGTEMSREALESMARQFANGVVYTPTHRDREWHEVIGRTVGASLIPVNAIDSAADASESQYLLRVETQLDMEKANAVELDRLLRRGDTIGQSIGGWFTQLTVVENREGEIERVIIQDVELDHLAVTRTPSNRESLDLTLRSRVGRRVQAFRAMTGDAMETRSEQPTIEIVEDAEPETELTEAAAPETIEADTAPVEAPEAAEAEEAPADTQEDAERADEPTEAEDERADEPGTPSADIPSVDSDDSGERSDQENTMNEEKIAELFRAALSEQSEKAEARIAAEREKHAAERAALIERIEKLETTPVSEETTVERTTTPYTRPDASELRGFAIDARDGEFGALIERAREEGRSPNLVAVSSKEKSRLARIRQLDDDNAADLGFRHGDDVKRAMKSSIHDLCRAYVADGYGQNLNPMAADSGWNK